MVQQQVLTPAQQQENAIINDIAQYVGAKWGGKPGVLVLFGERQGAAFRSITVNEVSEGQFIIAGEELLAMGRRIQAARHEQQFKVNVVAR